MNNLCYYPDCNRIADWCLETVDYVKIYSCDDHVIGLREQLKQEKSIILTICSTPHLLNRDPSLYSDK